MTKPKSSTPDPSIKIPDLPPPDATKGGTKSEGAKKRGRPTGTTKDKSAKQDTAPRTRAPSTRTVLKEGIAGLYRTAGMGLSIAGPSLMPVAQTAMETADEIAEAWVEVCDQSPQVRKFWEGLLQGSTYSKLLMAHAPLAIAIVGPRFGGSFFGGGGSVRNEAPTGATGARASAPPPPPPPPPTADTSPFATGDFNPAFAESANGANQ